MIRANTVRETVFDNEQHSLTKDTQTTTKKTRFTRTGVEDVVLTNCIGDSTRDDTIQFTSIHRRPVAGRRPICTRPGQTSPLAKYIIGPPAGGIPESQASALCSWSLGYFNSHDLSGAASAWVVPASQRLLYSAAIAFCTLLVQSISIAIYIPGFLKGTV